MDAAGQDISTLPGIAVFVAAGRAGSFTAAADTLGVTKSAVGKAIARLEQRLGVKLFHRTTRITRLTTDGEAYFAACARALDEIEAAEEAMTSANKIISGQLRINMPVAFGRQVLLPLLLEMSRPHPALTLLLTFTDATIDPLQEDVDLVIRFGALPDTSHVVARRLVSQARIICAAPSYLEQHGAPVSLDDLGRHRAIVGSRNGPPLHWVILEDGVERRLSPARAHQMSDGQAMVDAAVAGLGLCQAPASLVRNHLEDGRLAAVLQDYTAAPVEVHALWPKTVQLSPKVRYVVDQLRAAAARGVLD
jgi:DNA-binding transcriptional LysR family regulator